MSDTQNEPLPGEKAIKVKKAGPILLGADRYDIFEKGQKAMRAGLFFKNMQYAHATRRAGSHRRIQRAPAPALF